MPESIRVFAPATVANVSCGFDILGFAVDRPGDEVVVRLSDQPGVRITRITGDSGRLSYRPEENTVTVSMLQFLQHLPSEHGFEVELHKKMPFGSGLGSSAASTVAGAFAINEILDRPLTRTELLPFAVEGERIACGSAHADNVAPSLLGGFVLVRSYEPLDVISLPTPPGLYCAIIHPKIEVKTKDAREILRTRLQLKDAVVQWGNIAGLVAGIMLPDFDLIGRSMQDVIVEPIRSILIPGFDQVKGAAIEAGALGASISGSGPAMFALCREQDTARRAGIAMEKVFSRLNIGSEIFISAVNEEGPQVLEAGL